MSRASEINWNEIMDKFLKHDGRIIDFCRENNISHHQLYNQRKKLKKKGAGTFHALEVPKAAVLEDAKAIEQSIRIEIGNARIFLNVDDKTTLFSLVRELAKL